MTSASDLLSQTKRVRLDVYGGDVTCAAALAGTSGVPSLSRTFNVSDDIQLAVPSGTHTILATAFSDDQGTVAIAQACTTDKFTADARPCLDLVLEQIPDMSIANMVDLSMPDAACNLPCCLSDNDCAGDTHDGGPTTALCDLVQHHCVQCLAQSDCPSDQRCNEGLCVPGCDVSAGKLCPGALTCCDTTCIDLTNDPQHCGSCPNSCPASDTCCGGHCSGLMSTISDCGGCGRSCGPTEVATPMCASGLCDSSCQSGYGNCITPAAPTADDGCETNLNTSTGNCGACGRSCSTDGTDVRTCASCLCTSSCTAGHGNCTKPTAPTADDGCETDLTSAAHCGSCGNVCTGGQTCCGGNHCATLDSSVADCGGCSRACSGSHVSTQACAAGTCNSTCQSGFANCNQPTAPSADDGCETATGADVVNCGACGRACSAANTNTLSCASGLCNSTCATGYGNCTHPSAPSSDDGCETSFNDPNHCGNCSNVCSLPNATAGCPSGSCTVQSCSGGFQDCDGTASNGCECAGSACCGASCQTAHSNGTGQTYYDCVAIDTYNQTQATEAANASPLGGTIFAGHCGSDTTVIDVCNQTSSKCTCWGFANNSVGNNAMGHVAVNNSGSGCPCPASTDPNWH